jgi:hypothetical protein
MTLKRYDQLMQSVVHFVSLSEELWIWRVLPLSDNFMKYVRSDPRVCARMQRQFGRPNAPSQLLKFFTLSGQISYPIKILNHLRSLTKRRYLMSTWKGPKKGIQVLAVPFVSMVVIYLQSIRGDEKVIVNKCT